MRTTVPLAVTALGHGVVARSDSVAVVAIRAASSKAAIVHTRALAGKWLRFCRRLVSPSSMAYALACDLVAWSHAIRVEAGQASLAGTSGEGRGLGRPITAPGLGLSYIVLALPLGAGLRPILQCHSGSAALDCSCATLGILLAQLGLLKFIARLPYLRRSLGYQQALETCLGAWEGQTRRSIRFVPARSICWSGPRCFLEAAFGGIAVTELCESLLSVLVSSGSPSAGTLARFLLASTFAAQWSMVLCLLRRRGVVASLGASRWMGLMPPPPPGAQHLVMLMLERFERGLPERGRLPETQRGLWPTLAGAPMRERTKRCSINWWHSRPASKSSTAA